MSYTRVVAGRYRVARPAGSSGLGTMWLGRDLFRERDVAVKIVGRSAGSEEDRARVTARVLREVRMAARINSPHVLQMYDVLPWDDEIVIVMEYLPSRTLEQVLTDEGPLDPKAAARIGVQVLSALNSAHSLGIVHRDVKPANVLIHDSGRAVLIDFGLSTDESDRRPWEVVVGTVPYMAPEALHAADWSPAADLWSFGVMLYEAIEGRRPFDGDATSTIMPAVLKRSPRPPERAGPLAPLITALLRKDATARPSSSEALRALLLIAQDKSEDRDSFSEGQRRPGLAPSAPIAVGQEVAQPPVVGGPSKRPPAIGAWPGRAGGVIARLGLRRPRRGETASAVRHDLASALADLNYAARAVLADLATTTNEMTEVGRSRDDA